MTDVLTSSDDFTQLNEKFIKARRDYEALLESSMSQPQQYHQQQYPMRNHQSSYQLPQQHQQHQQQPYGGQMPPPGYPPQGQPQGPPQGPPPSGYQPYTAPNMPQQQDPQRYFSPGPLSEQPTQQGFTSPYPQQSAPPTNPAPFLFIPGGVQDQPQPPQSTTNIGRKPTPQQVAADPYATPSAPPGFQGQIRPGSIHTLNSGNPSELATGGYESPIDNRHSVAYEPYVPPQQQNQQRPDVNAQLQRLSLESPTSVYSSQQPPISEGNAPPPPHQQGPSAQTTYQAYQPYQPQTQQQPPPPQQAQGQQGVAGGDPGDFYR
jgi:signal transducing adaptor molecule